VQLVQAGRQAAPAAPARLPEQLDANTWRGTRICHIVIVAVQIVTTLVCVKHGTVWR
jgi:hypothetical protein